MTGQRNLETNTYPLLIVRSRALLTYIEAVRITVQAAEYWLSRRVLP